MTEPAHYKHGPSGAHRWLNCPGSIQAEAKYPDNAGDAADEGTAAHWLLEQCLKRHINATDWNGDIILAGEETGCKKDWPITGEMIESVQLAVDEVNKHAKKKGTQLWVEDRVRLDDTLGLPVPVGGTCDIRLYLPRSKVLIVTDFKYGKGHVVEIREKDGAINEQAGLYALGALYDFEKNHPDREVKWVELGIIQPRAYHKKGPVRTVKLSPNQLMDLELKLCEVVPITLEKDPPLVAGEKQCHFCKAKRDCLAYAAWRGEEARGEFEAEELPAKLPDGFEVEPAPTEWATELECQVIESGRDKRYPDLHLPTLPPASSLTLEQLGQLQKTVPWLEQWCKDVKEETRTRLLHDCKVPGKRLAQGPGSRPWADEQKASQAVESLLQRGDVKYEDLYEPAKLKTVAKVEKALGKAKFKKLLGEHVSYVAGGPVVVDEDSDKPEYVKPGEEFEAEQLPTENDESHPLL